MSASMRSRVIGRNGPRRFSVGQSPGSSDLASPTVDRFQMRKGGLALPLPEDFDSTDYPSDSNRTLPNDRGRKLNDAVRDRALIKCPSRNLRNRVSGRFAHLEVLYLGYQEPGIAGISWVKPSIRTHKHGAEYSRTTRSCYAKGRAESFRSRRVDLYVLPLHSPLTGSVRPLGKQQANAHSTAGNRGSRHGPLAKRVEYILYCRGAEQPRKR